MTLVKFIEATADYFKYSYETGATLVHQFIKLFQNNNAVLGELADELWAPGLEVTVVNKIYKSPNLQAGTLIKCTHIGTTGTTEPDWSTVGAVGSTVTDGGVTWLVIPQTGQEIATQDEVTAGTVANKVVTPATAAGCYLRIWQGTTAPTDLSGRSAWLNTNTDPAALYYYNTVKKAWQSAVAYAAGAGTAANANYVKNKDIDNYLPLAGGTMTGALTLSGAPTADLQAATKGYVDTAVSGVDGVKSSLLAKNGYIKFGNGVLVQWGGCTRSTTVSFPIPFSSTNYSVVVTPTGNNDSGYQNTRIPTKAQDSFYVAGANWNDGNWVAIGY